MKDQRDKNMNLRFVIRVVYFTLLAAVLLITVLICLQAPVQRHFKNVGKNDVWFGDGWHYTGVTGGDSAAGRALSASPYRGWTCIAHKDT